MNGLVSGNRWSRVVTLLAFCFLAAACGDSTQATTTSTTTGASTQSTVQTDTSDAPAAAPATPAELVEALAAAWTAGDETTLTELVPASAAELLEWGQPEFVNGVAMEDCTLGSAGTATCELLAGIDGSGLLFNMSFSAGPDGGLQIDEVTFGGDAG